MRSRFHRALSGVLGASGFEHHKQTWYWAGDEVLAVVCAGRDDARDRDLILLGLRQMRAGDAPFPRLADCEVIAPLSELVMFDSEMLDELMDPRSRLSLVDRILGFEALIQEAVLPLLKRSSTVQGMRELMDPPEIIPTTALNGVAPERARRRAKTTG